MMAAYKRNSKKGQDRGVYGAWRLWLEEGPVPEEELEQEEGLGPGKGPGPEENPDREEGLITVDYAAYRQRQPIPFPLNPLSCHSLWNGCGGGKASAHP